jgi:hypothetical protein
MDDYKIAEQLDNLYLVRTLLEEYGHDADAIVMRRKLLDTINTLIQMELELQVTKLYLSGTAKERAIETIRSIRDGLTN